LDECGTYVAEPAQGFEGDSSGMPEHHKSLELAHPREPTLSTFVSYAVLDHEVSAFYCYAETVAGEGKNALLRLGNGVRFL
jgi:hypothetical protein